MQYLALRDCFVEDRYHRKGEVYELPDDFPKYEKNFRLVSSTPESSPAQPSSLVCTVCGRECKSELGLKSHMRAHKKEA